jgi:hypothetical protein
MATFQRKGKAPQDPTQCPSGIDLQTFFTPVITEEIKSIVPLLHSTPIDTTKKLTKAVLNYLLTHSIVSNLDEDIYSLGLQTKETNQIVTGLYLILKISMRNKVKLSVIKNDLLKMNLPAPVVELLNQVVLNSRLQFENSAIQSRVQFLKLEKLRWRIDVVISSGSLTRVMRPNILMQVRERN